jgi:hypothetical protein
MDAILIPQVLANQAPKVFSFWPTMNPMQTGTHKKTFDAFAARLNEV